jgi:hypothetical protein
MSYPAAHADALLGELRQLIEDARHQVARTANVALTLTYWRIGKRLLAENLTEGRAAYGQQILASLAPRLEREFGKGFSYSALTRMVRFAELFPDEQILATLLQELTWSHFTLLLPLKDQLAREFYAEMCRAERWSVRTLRQKIGGMLFERTALSKHSEDVVRQELASLRDGQLSPDLVFRDPYLLDFLGLSGAWSEKTWRPPSCARWKPFCSKWAAASALSPARSACRWARTISIWICCFITVTSDVWSPSN